MKRLPKIVILGGGIAGLLAAWVLRAFKPLLLEAAPKLGGNFLAGGLKYIRKTPQAVAMLEQLGIPFRERAPVGLMYAFGSWWDHPGWLGKMAADMVDQVQRAHWLKTRGTTDGFRRDCMNDPAGNGADMMLECDLGLVIERLADGAEREGATLCTDARITNIFQSHTVNNCIQTRYDILVPTIPLGVLAKLAPWAGLPVIEPRKLVVIDMKLGSNIEPTWDYMYNPFDHLAARWGNAHSASRYTWQGPGHFQAEAPNASGWIDGNDPLAHAVVSQVKDEAQEILAPWTSRRAFATLVGRIIPGHLPPLAEPIDWPSCWRPLGRFAQWEPRATSERVLADAHRIHDELMV